MPSTMHRMLSWQTFITIVSCQICVCLCLGMFVTSNTIINVTQFFYLSLVLSPLWPIFFFFILRHIIISSWNHHQHHHFGSVSSLILIVLSLNTLRQMMAISSIYVLCSWYLIITQQSLMFAKIALFLGDPLILLIIMMSGWKAFFDESHHNHTADDCVVSSLETTVSGFPLQAPLIASISLQVFML